LLLEKIKFIFFLEGEVEVCAVWTTCEVNVVLHVVVELVIPKDVVLPPILDQRSTRRHLTIAQSALLNIVSVTRVSNPLRKANKTRLIMVILVQMLQLRFAISPNVRTRRNVLRRLPKGVMQQQKHMRARYLRFVRPSLQLRGASQ
jgi:hypothetical protein